LFFISRLEFSIDPVSLLDFSCLHIDLLPTAILLIVFPVTDIVIPIAVNLSTISTPLLVVLALPFVKMSVWLSEDLPANAFTFSCLGAYLAIDLGAKLVDALSIAGIKVDVTTASLLGYV